MCQRFWVHCYAMIVSVLFPYTHYSFWAMKL